MTTDYARRGRLLNVAGVVLAAGALTLIVLTSIAHWQQNTGYRSDTPAGIIALRLSFWLLPLPLTALPLLLRRPRLIRATRAFAAGVLWLYGFATFTLFFVPAALVMLVAAIWSPAADGRRPAAGG